MSVSQLYLFATPGNYNFDSAKVEVVGGKGRLKLFDFPDQEFNQPFDNDTGFTYDPTKAEFVSGRVQQINQRPADATFGANFNANINGNWGNGILTGTPTGGAAVSAGKLDLAHNDVRYVDYDADLNADSQQTGCIRFRLTPDYSGSPATAQIYAVPCKAHGDAENAVYLKHETNGQMWLFVHVAAGVNNAIFAGWNPNQGQEYVIELNYDFTAGVQRLFIDGSQLGGTKTITVTRTSEIGLLRIGSGFDGVNVSNFKIDDFVVFPTMQHTANYTPDYTILDTEYLATDVSLPQFCYTGPGTVQLLQSVVTVEVGLPRYTFQPGGVGDFYYWNGSAWVVSADTYNQANDIATFNANIASYPITGCCGCVFKIYFPESNTQSWVSDFTVTATGQQYCVSNCTIYPNSSLRIDELQSFVEAIVKSGSDDVKYAMRVNGINKYWNGSAWVDSTGYAESNTATEINTNATSLVSIGSDVLPFIYLHSEDGTTTPEVDEITISGDFSGPTPGEPVVIPVYGNVYDVHGNPLSGITVTAKLLQKSTYNDELDISTDVGSTLTDTNGYWELKLAETDSMLPEGSEYLFLIQGTNYTREYRVSLPAGAASYRIQELVT